MGRGRVGKTPFGQGRQPVTGRVSSQSGGQGAIAAEIKWKLISQRTRKSLARLKAEGRTLGRPVGSKKRNPILAPHDAYIRQCLAAGAKQSEIARSLNVHRHTVSDWVRQSQSG